MDVEKWSKSEKVTARRACDIAYAREISVIGDAVRAKAADLKNAGDLWDLCDYLNQKRKSVDGKYDYRYSMLPIVLARLVREGWLKREELIGLSEEKLKRIDLILSL